MTHENPMPHIHDARAHKRLDRLEERMDKVDGTMGDLRVDIGAIKTDIKWIRESLNPRVRKAQGSSDIAKALGAIALLAAIIAGLLGINA